MSRLPALFAPLLAVAAFQVAAGPAQAAPTPPRAEIAFANNGGVDDWRSEGDRVIYFKDRFRHWFRAELMTRAIDLPYTEHIGIDASPSGSLDRWSAIIVHGRRYPITSFEPVAGPPRSLPHKRA